MTDTLRGGVIGAGVFGGYHARQYARLPGVTFSGVYDIHPDRAAAVAMPLGGRAFADIEAFFDSVDVVTVASPATHHAEQALAAIAAGKPVYIEKPIGVAVAEADKVRAAAAAKGLIVACGHQERVIFRAMGLLDVPEQPLLLEALRHGPPSDRSRDVSAVLDLMIHDIDLCLAIAAANPVTAEAEGARGPDGVWDAIRAEVSFESGFSAVFDVSRLAEARKRTMRIVYPSGEVEVDFMARTFRNTTPFALNPDFADTPAASDPLGASVEAFLQAVRGEAPRPIVTADEAIAALDLAVAVEQALEDAA
ncbi:MAG: Gfo/Idh/MocA family oxidoreductase [Alphaproteobacteria bacterium]|nr:Gfo/Idh/MocA family oxidoreductase [Alphaproteobacteria bacterium]MBU1513945.1 Gfo/Idh/MocA family oxidoreductase [Alphaproteobacteria bacterium]MBU2092623.1 Gfo/Idh/MocA family oxidoreductase [Alphaproteobacteria bacterium]MBU2154256.1 Gfo/Idh/MocA family oxidoreductase [Alphaproteobacteria bacterium]MBU2309498.1 Gfo/Idh/MocA family oxidoreductase [Alphaproteobacteria bacterium]